MSYQDNVVWITGASSGIGRALAEAFAAEGAHIILSGRRVDALQKVASQLPTQSLVLPFEVTDFDAHQSLVDQAWEWSGKVDMLINNAGISQRSLAIDTEFSVYQRVLDIDLMAPISLTQALVPRMVARGSGHIMGMSSVAGRIGPPLRTAYAAAKHGLIGYLDALRSETESAYGLRVTTVLPGSVNTGIAINAIQADGSARGMNDPNIEDGMAPEEAARQILQGLAAGEREILVAEGLERSLAEMRHKEDKTLFDMLAGVGAQLAEQRAEALQQDGKEGVFVPKVNKVDTLKRE